MRFAVVAAFAVLFALFVGLALVDGSVDTLMTQNTQFRGIGILAAVIGGVLIIGVGLASMRPKGPSASADAASARLQGYSAVLHKLNAARHAGDATGYAALAGSAEVRAMLADKLLAGDCKAFENFTVSGQAALAGGAAGHGETATLDELFFDLMQALQRRDIGLRDGASVREVSRMKAVE